MTNLHKEAYNLHKEAFNLHKEAFNLLIETTSIVLKFVFLRKCHSCGLPANRNGFFIFGDFINPKK